MGVRASQHVIWVCVSPSPGAQIGPIMASKKRQQRGIHLVESPPTDPETPVRKSMAAKFRTGDLVPQSGIYQVVHGEHRLPHEVTLLRANPFPPCAQCGNKVSFKLLRGVTVDRFAITLNAIPELQGEAQPFSAAAGEEDSEKAS